MFVNSRVSTIFNIESVIAKLGVLFTRISSVSGGRSFLIRANSFKDLSEALPDNMALEIVRVPPSVFRIPFKFATSELTPDALILNTFPSFNISLP